MLWRISSSWTILQVGLTARFMFVHALRLERRTMMVKEEVCQRESVLEKLRDLDYRDEKIKKLKRSLLRREADVTDAFFPPECRGDEEIAMLAFKKLKEGLFKLLAPELQRKREVVMQGVRSETQVYVTLENCEAKFRDDGEIMLEAITHAGLNVFGEASDRLRSDRRFVLEAMANAGARGIDRMSRYQNPAAVYESNKIPKALLEDQEIRQSVNKLFGVEQVVEQRKEEHQEQTKEQLSRELREAVLQLSRELQEAVLGEKEKTQPGIFTPKGLLEDQEIRHSVNKPFGVEQVFEQRKRELQEQMEEQLLPLREQEALLEEKEKTQPGFFESIKDFSWRDCCVSRKAASQEEVHALRQKVARLQDKVAEYERRDREHAMDTERKRLIARSNKVLNKLSDRHSHSAQGSNDSQ